MPRQWSRTVTIEAVWELCAGGHWISDIEYRATATVSPDHEVTNYCDVELWSGTDRVWVPGDWIGMNILAELHGGSENERFIAVAMEEGFGADPDARRDLMRAG